MPIPPSKAIVGANAFAHESGIHQHGVIANARTYEIMNSTDVGIPQNTMVLGKHSGKHALREKLESMGYELSDEELESVFTRFKDLADKKKNITSSDIEALVLHRQAAVQGSCQLVSHVVNTGHGVPNISCIKLQRGDEQIEDVAIGTGPLDASFKAINRMLQMDVKLESFSLNAVTDGEDAIGEAVVKVRPRRALVHRLGALDRYHRIVDPRLRQRHQQDHGIRQLKGETRHGHDNDAENSRQARRT